MRKHVAKRTQKAIGRDNVVVFVLAMSVVQMLDDEDQARIRDVSKKIFASVVGRNLRAISQSFKASRLPGLRRVIYTLSLP